MENHWSVTRGQSDFFSYKSFKFLMSIKIPPKRYKPENLHVSLFGTVLSISDNIMHYQWLISVFLKSTSCDQLLQKAYWHLRPPQCNYQDINLLNFCNKCDCRFRLGLWDVAMWNSFTHGCLDKENCGSWKWENDHPSYTCTSMYIYMATCVRREKGSLLPSQPCWSQHTPS